MRRQFFRVFGEMKSFSQGSDQIKNIPRFQAFHRCGSLSDDPIDDLNQGLFRMGSRNAEGPSKEKFFPVVDLQIDELAGGDSLVQAHHPSDEKVMICTKRPVFDNRDVTMKV